MTDKTAGREEPPALPADINELCGAARIGAAIMEGWGRNPHVDPAVAYSCRYSANLIAALTDRIRDFQKGVESV